MKILFGEKKKGKKSVKKKKGEIFRRFVLGEALQAHA